MAIELYNGVSLPDIPADVLAQYPQACIVQHNSAQSGVSYTFMASSFIAFASKELLESLGFGVRDGVGALTYGQMGTCKDGDVEWAMEDFSNAYVIYLGRSNSWTQFLIWANTDIYEITNVDMSTGQYQIGDVYYRVSTDQTEYRVPATFLTDIANKIRTTISPIKGLTVDEIQSEFADIIELYLGLANCKWLANATCASDENYVYTLHSDATELHLPNFVTVRHWSQDIKALDLPNATVIGQTVFANNDTITTVRAPNVEVIDWGAFMNCSALVITGEEFPNLREVCTRGFENCYSLVNLSFPLVTEIGEYAFQDCENLLTVDCPNLLYVDDYAFSGCSSLESVSAPLATVFDNYAFSDCTGLVSIDLPSAKDLTCGCFQNCTNLEQVNIPNATHIGIQTFLGCSTIQKIDLPSATLIGSPNHNMTFYNSSNLTALILRSETMVAVEYDNDQKMFYGTPIADGTGYIYVPSALVDSYKADAAWSTYAAQFRALEDYTVDGTITGELDESKI